MQLDPELAVGIQAMSQIPNQPPEGVPAWKFMRDTWEQQLGPRFSKFWGTRLPSDIDCTSRNEIVAVEKGQISVRCIIPDGGATDQTYPVLVWLHGGGWMLGNIEVDDNHLRTIALELKIAVVNVDYRLAPEHPFPTGFNDCYTALKWVADNAGSLKVALDKGFIVGGDSAGGNLAAAVVLKTRDDPFFKGRKLTGQYLREPLIFHPHAHPEKYEAELRSFNEFTDTPFANRDAVLLSCEMYKAPPTDLRVSPLLAETHAGLPPTFFQVMEYDPLRDAGLGYEKVLREAGVKTKLIRYPGVVHSFYYVFPELSVSEKVDRDIREGLRWLLSL